MLSVDGHSSVAAIGKLLLVGSIMSKTVDKPIPAESLQEPAIEAIKRMIRYTRKESDKDGRTFCSYFLDMALQSLEDGTEDLDMILKTKITPLMVGQQNISSKSDSA
ncbi:hypothetical protein [uncultured Roseibium sp.]|uniref:hypothetical protein n=1 Tax=uncultured Roseibium sp. TaxID=1936171 RepID=UPI00262208D5|nr:hypothetical protein [uncultured Roseibium sp.]